MGYDLALRVWRGDADGGEFVDYTVPVEEGEVVLDAVHRLQATQAGDLAVRWNCKAGKCGSCSAEVNGVPRLMCMTRLNVFDPAEVLTVTPMRSFPVIRDLVTDVSFNFEMARRMPPFAPRPRDKDGAYRMAQVDVERGQEFRKCIECFLCQNTCHVIRDHEENKPVFAGPRMFIKYAELEMHPLDTNDRRQLLQERMGLGYCNITKCCTEVCPESIHITDNAIIPLKERVVDGAYDPAVFITRTIGRRSARRVVGPAGGDGPSPIKRPPGVVPPPVPAAGRVGRPGSAQAAPPVAVGVERSTAAPSVSRAVTPPTAPSVTPGATPGAVGAGAQPASGQFARWVRRGALPAVGAGMLTAMVMRRRLRRRRRA